MSFKERDYVQRILNGEEQVVSNMEMSYFNGEAIIPIAKAIKNAIKFTPKDGSINVNIINHQDYVEIYIKDTGIGIPEDKLDEIFERFKRLESNLNRMNEGSGIGLSLVKALVKAHQGEIYAKSELGNVSEFKIRLPAIVLKYSKLERNREMSHRSLVERTSIEFSDIYSVND